MAKFAKIFELPNDNQVLVTLDYNPDDDSTDINCRSSLNGMNASLKFGYKDHDEAVSVFNDFSEDQAKAIRSRIQNLFN